MESWSREISHSPDKTSAWRCMSQRSGRIHLVVLFPPKQCSEGGASNTSTNYSLLIMPKQNKKSKKTTKPKSTPAAATVKNPAKTSTAIFPGKTW
jgi:hypothetical protein